MKCKQLICLFVDLKSFLFICRSLLLCLFSSRSLLIFNLKFYELTFFIFYFVILFFLIREGGGRVRNVIYLWLVYVALKNKYNKWSRLLSYLNPWPNIYVQLVFCIVLFMLGNFYYRKMWQLKGKWIMANASVFLLLK